MSPSSRLVLLLAAMFAASTAAAQPAQPPPGTQPPPGPQPPPGLQPLGSQPLPETYNRWRLALQTEAAIGISGDGFYNHLAGARVDHRFTRRVALGGYLGYANLKGKEDRVHNVLPYAMLEYRAPLTDSLALPLRYAMGFLPNNGPLLRFAAGLSLALGDSLDLTADLLTPTIWLTHDEPVWSFDLALELAYTF